MASGKRVPRQSLTLRVPHVKEEGEPFLVELDEEELRDLLAGVGDYRPGGRGLKATLHLSRFAENVSVRGQVETWVTYTCSRCLVDTTERIGVDLHWRFLPSETYRETATPDEEVELTAEDLDVSFYAGDEINLLDVIREALLLELPPYPACREGCPEPVPVAADAEQAAIDPRWMPLLDLKKRGRS